MINPEKVLNIADIDVEGLEKEKGKWLGICIDGSEEEILRATQEYTKKIEEATNQPWNIVHKKVQFTNLNGMVVIDRDPGRNTMIRMRDGGATGKSLHEKAKSSVHGISLAGYIPFNQVFGKAGDNGQTKRFNDVVKKRFESQKEDEIKLNALVDLLNSGQILTKEQEQEKKEILAKDLVSKQQLQNEQGKEIYGYRDDSKKPVFAYKNENGEFTNEETGENLDIESKKKLEKIEVISYVTDIEKNAQGQFQIKVQKITGDHDQLSVGTRAKRSATLDDITLSSDRGFADDIGHAVTAALIDETKESGAVRHGEDSGGAGTRGSLSLVDLKNITAKSTKTNSISYFLEIYKALEDRLGGNPYPEDFAEGNYAIYQPNGKISVAHNEQEIVDAYNRLEKLGFNIGINPRYGWNRNKENKLQLDPSRISAQSFIKAKAVNEASLNKSLVQEPAEKKAEIITACHDDSDLLYKVNSVLSLVKLQESTSKKSLSEKNFTIIIVEAMLLDLEKDFAKKYKIIPPTIGAMVNDDQKAKRLTSIKKYIQLNTETKMVKTKAGSMFELSKNMLIKHKLKLVLHAANKIKDNMSKLFKRRKGVSLNNIIPSKREDHTKTH
jgi:hypothetical protein